MLIIKLKLINSTNNFKHKHEISKTRKLCLSAKNMRHLTLLKKLFVTKERIPKGHIHIMYPTYEEERRYTNEKQLIRNQNIRPNDVKCHGRQQTNSSLLVLARLSASNHKWRI